MDSFQPYTFYWTIEVEISHFREFLVLNLAISDASPPADLQFVDVPRGASLTVTLKKEGTGLGFSLEGGKDSPYGDRPMTVKKIFTGTFTSLL